MQDLLEIVNPSSWGTNRHDRAADLNTAYFSSGSGSVIMKEKSKDSNPDSDVDSDTGRGTGDIFTLSPEELREMAREARR